MFAFAQVRVKMKKGIFVLMFLLLSSVSLAETGKETLEARLQAVQAQISLQESNFERGRLMQENAQMRYEPLKKAEEELKKEIADLEKVHAESPAEKPATP